MIFAKGHGTQNDFVLLPDLDAKLTLTPAVVTRSTPSAPSPRRRSHNAATTVGVSVSLASRSGSNTKSFCVP